jgi:hypothetical protein
MALLLLCTVTEKVVDEVPLSARGFRSGRVGEAPVSLPGESERKQETKRTKTKNNEASKNTQKIG